MKEISIFDIEGLKMGHYTDQENKTGATFIKVKGVASVDVRGGAPASKELALLSPENAVASIDGILLTGGSAYGLEASCGILQGLEEDGEGFDVGKGVVPIVPSAAIFDLYEGAFDVRPDKAAGYKAYKSLGCPEDCGPVGAGTGASIGKYFGPELAVSSGLGIAGVQIGALKVAAIVVVNAFGSLYEGNEMIAGPMIKGKKMPYDPSGSAAAGFNQNTTIGAIITNAKLSKSDCKRLAMNTHDAYARCIRPVHTQYDGDLIFAVATEEIGSVDMLQVSEMANMAMEKAIKKSIK